MKAEIIAAEFRISGKVVSARPYGEGNVNDTYLVTVSRGQADTRFILQQLNLCVFPSPEAVMRNIRIVTEHINEKLRSIKGKSDRRWRFPMVIPTTAGSDFLLDEQGHCWRAISFIESARAPERVRNAEHAHEVGYVLGRFQELISDIPINELRDTLPGFHVTPGYLARLDESLASMDRREKAATSAAALECLEFIANRRDWCVVLEEARKRGDIAERPIHGDPKVSNVMIDEVNNEGVGMIDLDTVKPGLIHYDIGDCLRSGCNPLGEDIPNPNDIFFDTRLCEAIVAGYARAAGSLLTDSDRDYLYESVRLLAFETGLRFFADHIAGDTYFKTIRKGQNLNRARVQFALCRSIENQESAIRQILGQI